MLLRTQAAWVGGGRRQRGSRAQAHLLPQQVSATRAIPAAAPVVTSTAPVAGVASQLLPRRPQTCSRLSWTQRWAWPLQQGPQRCLEELSKRVLAVVLVVAVVVVAARCGEGL